MAKGIKQDSKQGLNRHDLICINCPLSCALELYEEGGEVKEVKGAECKIGQRYAVEEFTNPRRVLTTTVKAVGGLVPMLPVRSIEPIPRPLLKDAVIMLARVVVEAPVAVGQVIYPDILGTGIDVIASRALEKLDGDYSNSGV